MSELPLPPKDKNMSPADDVTLTTSHPQDEKLRDIITPYLNVLQDLLESIKLKLAAKKSSATVFTTWSKKAKLGPHLIINNSATPVMSKGPWCQLRLYAQFWRTCRKYQRKLQKCNNILNKLLAVTAVIRADVLIMKQPVVNSFRPMRPTLNDTFKNRVKQHTNNREQLSLKEYKNALKSIH